MLTRVLFDLKKCSGEHFRQHHAKSGMLVLSGEVIALLENDGTLRPNPNPPSQRYVKVTSHGHFLSSQQQTSKTT